MDMKLQKIGNSHMVTIPAKLMKSARLSVGQSLRVSFNDGKIEISTLKKIKVAKKLAVAPIKLKTISIPNFDFKQSMKWIKESRYDR